MFASHDDDVFERIMAENRKADFLDLEPKSWDNGHESDPAYITPIKQ